jgi:pimeloyl-ACP methyl ester carboxylesterase
VFEGFTLETVDTGGAKLRVRYGGTGPALLLLHGHPRTHVTWHRVAPLLACDYTVVCPDLRGYGESSKPATTADHEPYSKRAMAADMLALMRTLGHARFAVAGHDRGAYVALRLALDHPAAVSRLVVMDAIPIGEALARCDARFAGAWWHWFFLGSPDAGAERVISADPDAWYHSDRARALMGEEAWPDFHRAIHFLALRFGHDRVRYNSAIRRSPSSKSSIGATQLRRSRASTLSPKMLPGIATTPRFRRDRAPLRASRCRRSFMRWAIPGRVFGRRARLAEDLVGDALTEGARGPTTGSPSPVSPFVNGRLGAPAPRPPSGSLTAKQAPTRLSFVESHAL